MDNYDNNNMRSLEPSEHELQNRNVKSNNFHHKDACCGTKNTIKRRGSHNNSEFYSTTMPVVKRQKTQKSPPVSVINTPRPHPMNTVPTSTPTPTPTPTTNIDKTDDDENWVDDLFNAWDYDDDAEVDKKAKFPNVISYSMVSDDESSFVSDFSQSFQQQQEEEKKKRGRCDSTVPSLPSLPSTPRKQQNIPVAFDPYPILLKDCSRLPPSCTDPKTNTRSFGEEDQGCRYSSSPLFQEEDEEEAILNSVTNCKDPMFLTLTSYPFRVFYANQAYQTQTTTGIGNSPSSSSIIGKSFYEIFGGIKEGTHHTNTPDFWSCKGILECGYYHPQQDMARIQVSPANGEEDDGHRGSSFYSTVQVRPILKKSSTMPNNDADLRYFAVTLKEITR